MNPASKRTFSLMLSGVLLLAAFVGYAALVRPSYDEIIALRSALNAKSDLLREQNMAIAKVNDLIVQYQGTGRLQDTISLSFPLKEELSSIFNQLRTLAEINNLSIEIFGVKPQAFKVLSAETLVKNAGTLELSLRLVGSYENFREFIKGVETNIRLMDVQQVAIEKISGGNNFFSYNLLINTYYQSDK